MESSVVPTEQFRRTKKDVNIREVIPSINSCGSTLA